MCTVAAALAELIVEHHSTAESMSQVTVAMKCSLHKKKVVFFFFFSHPPAVMGLGGRRMTFHSQINVAEKCEFVLFDFIYFFS